MSGEFYYQLPWRAAGVHAGRHHGLSLGEGFELWGYVPFASQPDPRRLDVRAMLTDPFGQLMVKSFRQRSAIPVYVLADLSASMGFRGQGDKMALLGEFAASVAWSAWRSGDPFGFFACEEQVRWDLSLPLRWHRGFDDALRQCVQAFRPQARGAAGLLEAATMLGRHKSLVFLVSDFHWPSSQREALFQALARHDVVPVVLWDSGEYEHLPRFGMVELRDPETGQHRRLWLRPGLLERLQNGFRQRRMELSQFCSAHGREPFFLVDRYDADAMTRYFYPA